MTESIMDISSPRSYDASNRIESSSRVAYDAAGDMTRDGKHSYQFDAERRISRIDGGAAEYLYSAEGDRIEKRVGGEATETIWVGNDPIAELKPDGTWVDYLYLDGRRVAAISKSDATYYVADPLGMTRMELSATGDILAQSDMTPFGQLINRRSDADEVPFTGGEQYDAESGLYSYKYRSYNPQLGRWMSPDPSDEEFARVSNPQSLNLYSYVINDPLKYVDKLGLTGCPTTIDGRQPDGSYKAPTGPGSEIYKRLHPPSGGMITAPDDSLGQCVTATSCFSGVTRDTKQWTPGLHALNLTDADIGLAIATFDGDHYPTDGHENSGIYMGRAVGGIYLLDQWPSGRPPTLRFVPTYPADNTQHPSRSDNADAYYVIRVP